MSEKIEGYANRASRAFLTTALGFSLGIAKNKVELLRWDEMPELPPYQAYSDTQSFRDYQEAMKNFHSTSPADGNLETLQDGLGWASAGFVVLGGILALSLLAKMWNDHKGELVAD